jgi:hypothetical protein
MQSFQSQIVVQPNIDQTSVGSYVVVFSCLGEFAPTTYVDRVTHTAKIRKILERFAPPPDRRDEFRRDIESALNRVKVAVVFSIYDSGKHDLQRYANDLRRVSACYRRLTPTVRLWHNPPMINDAPVEREIEKIEAFLKQPSQRAGVHNAAIWAASDFLRWWGRKATATRGGEWDWLSGMLIGKTVDLLNLLAKFKRNPQPPVEKLHGEGWVLYRTATLASTSQASVAVTLMAESLTTDSVRLSAPAIGLAS